MSITGAIINAIRHSRAIVAKQSQQHALQPVAHLGSKTVKDAPNHIDPNCGVNYSNIHAEICSPTPMTGTATLKFPSSAQAYDKYQNSAKAIHGGIQFALHDLASCAVLSARGYAGATKAANIVYIAPARADKIEHLQAIATIRSLRGNTATLNSDLIANHHELISSAQMVFSIWENPQYKSKL